MIKSFLLLFCTLSVTVIFGQNLTGTQLLDKSITYHDPQGNWDTFKGQLFITMKTPDSGDRLSEITIDLPYQYFRLVAKKDNIITEQILEKGSCKLLLNGSETVSEDDVTKHRLTCERTQTMKNYYTYLYGSNYVLSLKVCLAVSSSNPFTDKGTYTTHTGKSTCKR